MLATAQDLLVTQMKNLQVRYNMCSNDFERASPTDKAQLAARWEKLKENLKNHGLSTV
jgi:hypothetical protein